jgi:hypothetical protein
VDRGRARGRWLPAFVGLEWRADERALVALLDALTRDRLEAEAVERERSATARRSLAEVQADQKRVARDELAEARGELDEFRAALEDARRRGGTRGQTEVPYDSAQAPQNAYADLLIQYLVRPGYAEVRTEEPAPGRYVYYIRVDWPRLRKLAESSGHPIPF